jgi:hypothetical protein
MKNRKRALTPVLLFLLALCLAVGQPARAAELGERSATVWRPEYDTSIHYRYFLREDGGVTLVSCTGNAADLVIPDQLDGYPVVRIDLGAFSSFSGLESVTIPASVTQMGANPFVYCPALTRIDVAPENPVYASIDGVLVDARQKALIAYPQGRPGDTYTVPEGISVIYPNAFYFCSQLAEVSLPDGLHTIYDQAFIRCSGLKDLRLPDSLVDIGPMAFARCSGLTDLRLPGRLVSIRDGAFSSCSGLTDLTFPDTLASIGDGAFSGCVGLTELRIPGSVSTIGAWAFQSCTGLVDVALQPGVADIGEGAFYGCKGLMSATVLDSAVGDFAFEGCPNLTLTVTEGSQAARYAEDHSIPTLIAK